MRIDPAREPFSRFGSWLSLRWSDGPAGKSAPLGPGLYLRTHHAMGDERSLIARLDLLRDGAVIPARVIADTGELHLIVADHEDAAALSFCLEGPGTLRIGGRGLGLRLNAIVGQYACAYHVSAQATVINSYSCRHRYAVEALHGRMELDAAWSNTEAQGPRRIVLDALPAADGVLELAIDEHGSTWRRGERLLRSAVAHEAATACAAFTAGFGVMPEAVPAAGWDLSGYVIWSATVPAAGLYHRPAVLMSKRWMTQVWSWDHCFNALALAGGHDRLAWDQLLLLFDHQDTQGCLPDSLSEQEVQYCFCKPPVHGWCARELIRRTAPELWRPLLPELYERLARWTRWWLDHRRAPGQRLPHYVHGNDSGWDNATMFEAGVPLVAPDLACLLVDQTAVMADLAAQLGRGEEAAAWRQESASLATGLLELWDGRRFVPRRLGVDGIQPVANDSLIPCMPLFLGSRLPLGVRQALLADLCRFRTPHGLATEAPASPRYAADGYWRGPIWAPPTLIAAHGLAASGAVVAADALATDFCTLVASQGAAENFDALTGAGLRDRAYTWTASVFFELARRRHRQE